MDRPSIKGQNITSTPCSPLDGESKDWNDLDADWELLTEEEKENRRRHLFMRAQYIRRLQEKKERVE